MRLLKQDIELLCNQVEKTGINIQLLIKWMVCFGEYVHLFLNDACNNNNNNYYNSFPADGENSIQEETGSPRRYVQLSHRKGLFEVRSINLTHKETIQ